MGETVVTHEGIWTAGTWRMQQRMGLESLGVKSTPNRPLLVDAGSVTTYLLLGQAALAERFPVITLHEALEPEEAFWNMELDDEGQHQIRTHVGRLAFRLDERGGIDVPLHELDEVVAGLRREMAAAANNLDFERAAELRDRIRSLEEERLRAT